MLNRILFVDDEPNVLHALERQFRKQFELQTAVGPELGLQAIAARGPFAVVVSDLRMPGMDGIEFLVRVRQIAPDTVRIMLTGQAELSTAIAAVNQGNIFQFLAKPCPQDELARTLELALQQHRLITAEKQLLEQTLRSSIGVMTEILSLVNPTAFSRAQRIRRYVRHMAERLDLPNRWQYEIAAMLSQIGCVAVPPDILDKWQAGNALNPREQEILSSQGAVGYKLLAKIPRLEMVAGMIAAGQIPWPGPQASNDQATIGAHLLTVAADFDAQTLSGQDAGSVLRDMYLRKYYNPAFLAALQESESNHVQGEVRSLTLSEIRPNMITNAAVYATNGLLLLSKGQEVTESVMLRLHGFARTTGVIEPINVIVPRVKAHPTPPSSRSTDTALNTVHVRYQQNSY